MPFKFDDIFLKGVKIICPKVFSDSRGFFMESYKKSDFEKIGILENFIQDNHSCSDRGVLRGIHFQNEPHAQGKLVRVVRGSVWDVAVDLRNNSTTYGKYFGIELTEKNHTMFYIPPGFGHGFLTLEDNTHFLYKCTEEYAPEFDSGIKWDDPFLNIEWPITEDMNVCISDKDKNFQYLEK